MPVIFHNLKGYDGHLIFKELSGFNGLKIRVIPSGMKKYMAFTLNKNILFIDSMKFMNCGLDKLVKNLSDKDFKCLSSVFNNEKLKLVKQKGVYPYEYMNSYKRSNENELPDRVKFFSSSKEVGIHEKEYKTAINVWKVFEVDNMGQYHDLYLKTDVLLLCDALKNLLICVWIIMD